jgi:O-methyltransferase
MMSAEAIGNAKAAAGTLSEPLLSDIAPFDVAAADRYRAAFADVQHMAGFIDFVIAGLLTRDHRSIFWGDRLLTLDKSCGFLEEPAFGAALEVIRGSHRYDQYASPLGIAWRLHTLVWAARTALALPQGDFVECGVFKGDMAWVVGRVTRFETTGRLFHLYDSFAGFDPAQSTAADFPDSPRFFAFAESVYSEPGLYERVAARFAAQACYRIHQGYLPASLDHPDAPQRIGFLHIDLNAPAAELGCLDRLFGRVVPGGVIVLDDYGWRLCRAQKDAEDRFFAGLGYSVLELPTGQGLVVKR